MNGLTEELLLHNPNKANPNWLSPRQAVTCDMDHDYTPEQQAFDGGLMDKFVEFTSAYPGQKDCDSNGLMAHFDGNTVTALWNSPGNRSFARLSPAREGCHRGDEANRLARSVADLESGSLRGAHTRDGRRYHDSDRRPRHKRTRCEKAERQRQREGIAKIKGLRAESATKAATQGRHYRRALPSGASLP